MLTKLDAHMKEQDLEEELKIISKRLEAIEEGKKRRIKEAA